MSDNFGGSPALSRRGVLRRAGLLSAGAAAAPLLRPGRAAAAGAQQAASGSGLAGPAPQSAAVPGLDDLAGTWMPAGTLLNLPSVSNFSGSLHAGSNVLSFLELTLPPLSLGGECARVSLNGVNVQAHETRWYPYQVLRSSQMGAITLQSAVRMGFEQELVLLELQVTNTASTAAAQAGITVELGGYLRSYPGVWQWGVPRQYGDFSAWSGQLADGGQVLAVTDSQSGAAAAFAFPTPPSQLAAAGNSGTASWNITLHPGEQRSILLLMAAGASASSAVAAAVSARAGFASEYAHAKAGWEQRFSDAFTPGNSHFSGSLPVLETSDQQLHDLYYRAVLSVLELERTCYPQFFPRAYATAAPQWGCTLVYFWDTSLFAPILSLLDPAMVSQQAKQWLELGIYNGYAVDALSGQLVGPWYSANDQSVFTMLLSYVTYTGDLGFLDEQAGSMTVIDHLQSIALNWQRLVVPATGLADYGGQSNLLEEVANYVNQVPSLNGANVWMMREVAALRQMRGETATATQLNQQADQLLAKVLALYVPGQGVWETVHDNGTRVPVRHVYDFDVIGRLLTGDLTATMRSEMSSFATSELLAGGWMRALSLSDPDAATSLRPDHGSNGAYDAWPALAAGAMARFGEYGETVRMLRTFDGAGAEGPFSQSHELVPEPSGLVVWDRDDLNPVTGLTVAAWVNPANWPAQPGGGAIVAKDAAAGAWYPTTPPNVGYTLRGGGSGQVSFAVAVGGGLKQATSKAAVPAGGWHHVAGTFDGQTVAIYIDGALAGTAAAAGSISASTGTNVMVAADPIDPQAKFSGTIDEVRIYNRALAAGEVAALSSATDAGYGGTDPALVLRLPMDEGSGQQTADAVTGQQETVIAGNWVPGRFGTALSFTKSAQLTARISRQQYNENNGGTFASTILQDLFGYAPDGQRIVLRDQGTPRGVDARLHGIGWRGKLYTLSSTPSGMTITPGG